MLDYPVTYYGVELNTIESLSEGKRRGCILEEFDFGQVRGIGYSEKRAQDDGMDASDVFLSNRIINLTGVVYGESTGDLHDRLQDIRTVLTPTVAYGLDTPDYGYIPLQFSLPTNKTDDFSNGLRPLEFRARPVGQPQFSIRRDSGSEPGALNASGGGGVLWRATLECKDPRMYVRPDVWVNWTAATGSPSPTIKNRGDYPAPLDILLVLGAATSATSKVDINVGDSNLTIKLGSAGPPVETFPLNTIIRYSGELKVLTVQTPGATSDVLRMDLISFRNNTTHPKMPPGVSSYSVVPTAATFASGTRFMFSESFA